MTNLSRIDLNLLVVLQAILAEGGVSPAARTLNLTQPTISHALARLRTLFDDPLFVRRGRRLVPTPFARGLSEPLGRALHALGAVVATAGRFDPAHSPAVFTVAVRDPLETAVATTMVRRLARTAPNVDLRFVDVRRRFIEASLADGTLDAAIDIDMPLSSGIRRQRIADDGFVVVARKANSRIGRRLSLDTYLALQHVMVSSRRRGAAPEDVALEKQGLRRHVRLRCRSLAAAWRAVEQADFVLTLPKRSATLLPSSAQTRLMPPPFDVPPIVSYLYWHEGADADAANAWLRAALLDGLVAGKRRSSRPARA
jgi:DNA-binding transcriptional LysR family regulator